MNEGISWEFQEDGSSTPVPLTSNSRIVIGKRNLTIERLEIRDGGVYTCVASHYLVEAVRTSIELEVEGAHDVCIYMCACVGVYICVHV